MIYAQQQIVLEDEILVLNNLRAVYWEKENALILSDLHIGKSAHFRRHGIAISSKIQHNDLDRMSFLVSLYSVKRLIVVGDLFHAEVNSDFDRFRKWRSLHQSIEILLIKGNHDRISKHELEKFKLECVDTSLLISPFNFIHEPVTKTDNFTISGHIHPGVSVNVKSGPRIKLPCFQVLPKQLILPAFSEFTGLNLSKTTSNSKYYAFTKTAFFEFN